jgi:hypothetical protein
MSIEIAEGIPGWMSVGDLRVLAARAAKVREGGHLVEVGPFLGRSTYVFATACHPSVTVHAVDPWSWLPSNYGPDQPGGPIDPTQDAEALFDKHVAACSNVRKYKGYSPNVHPPVLEGGFDFVFIDGDHRSPGFDRDVEFYYTRMAPDGVLMGDDYTPDWPNIKSFLKSFASRHGIKLKLHGEKLWELVRQP